MKRILTELNLFFPSVLPTYTYIRVAVVRWSLAAFRCGVLHDHLESAICNIQYRHKKRYYGRYI